MKYPSSNALNDTELDFLNDLLSVSDSEDAIMCVSELDGFLTAIVSGPNMIQTCHWLPELWGGSAHEPDWESEPEFQRSISLIMQHMNSIITVLMERPEHYVPLFNTSAQSDELILIAEEWCFGYMRGVDLGDWHILPVEEDAWLNVIALHGRAESFDVLETLSPDEHQESVMQIGDAVLNLHQYFLAQRTPPSSSRPAIARTGPKVGRNDPCPCGSGKKFKRCCLH